MTHTHVLLHEIEGPVNLGSVCRAMANTGFQRLRFSGLLEKDDFEARKYAVHARDILDLAEHAADLDGLINGLDVVFGFSPRRPQEDGHNLTLDQFHEHYEKAQSQGKQIGLMFGNEARGLTNQQLAWCHFRVSLPTHETYASMNLAQAVLVVLWEISRTNVCQDIEAPPDIAGPAEHKVLLENLRGFLDEMAFLNPQNPEHLWQEIVPIFRNREWTAREMTLLHGIFGKCKSRHKALKKKLERVMQNE